MKTSFAAAALGVLLATSALSSAEAAERWPRWYIGLSGGYTVMSDQDITGPGGVREASLESGYGYGGSIGYLPSSSAPILNSLRFEAEVTHHTADLDKISIGGGKISGRGNYASTAYMANVFYDFPTSSAWSPYVGAGVGIASVHLSTNSGIGNTEGSDNAFAYQGLVGVGYTPTSIPNTQWSLGYRYLATSDLSYGTAGGGNVKAEYSTHSLEAGAKFRF